MNCFSIFLGLIFEDSKSGKTRRPKGLMGEDGVRGKDWLRARGHKTCVLQTQFSIFYPCI